MLSVGEEHQYCAQIMLLGNNSIFHGHIKGVNQHAHSCSFQFIFIVGIVCMYCAIMCELFALDQKQFSHLDLVELTLEHALPELVVESPANTKKRKITYKINCRFQDVRATNLPCVESIVIWDEKVHQVKNIICLITKLDYLYNHFERRKNVVKIPYVCKVDDSYINKECGHVNNKGLFLLGTQRWWLVGWTWTLPRR